MICDDCPGGTDWEARVVAAETALAAARDLLADASTYNLANLCPHPKGGVDASAAVPHLRIFLANGWQPYAGRRVDPLSWPTRQETRIAATGQTSLW